MRRIATVFALAALLSGVSLLPAAAGDGCCRHGRHGYFYGPPVYAPPANPWAAWRAYYEAQANLNFVRRTARAHYYYAATGWVPPARYFGPPTNYYAERYALEPYSYFTCPEARRGEGICASVPPLSAVP